MCLSDYIHFICQHSSSKHLNKIKTDLENNYSFYHSNCNTILSDCIWINRHYRINRDQTETNHNFYINLFATLHFYLFHLEHVGFRYFKTITEVSQDISCVDKYFTQIQKQIEIKRRKYERLNLNIQRLNPQKNSKFNIVNINTNITDDTNIEQKKEHTFI
eukprot:437741_1